MFCRWFLAPLCWLDQATGCRVRLLCRLHDRSLSGTMLAEDVYDRAVRRVRKGTSGVVPSEAALALAAPDVPVGYACQHMSVTASGIVADSLTVSGGCDCTLRPIYATT